jgi:threonine dehydratase
MNKVKEVYKLISPYIKKTPIQYCDRLSKIHNAEIFLKREDLQITRSFKIRGALNKILNSNDNNNNIVCASAGNHAQGVGYVCDLLNIQGDIFIPENTPLQKVKSIEKYNNINLHKYGKNFNSCLQKAQEYSEQNNYLFIHPFNDHKIIEGQSTVGYEIFQEMEPDYIVTSVGGGGLISGLIKSSESYNTKIVAVEPKNADSLNQSLKHDKIVKLENIDTFVDGASVEEIGNITYEICHKYQPELHVIDKFELSNEIINLYQNEGIITEPAGSLSISALSKMEDITNKKVVCIISGGNNDLSRYSEMIEYSLQYENKKHYFLVEFTQNPGELKRFVNNIISEYDDISRFEYLKKNNKKYGTVLIGIETENVNQIIENFHQYNFNYKKIENQNLIYKLLI